MAPFTEFSVYAFLPPMLQYLDSQFPRACSTCARQFSDFADYVGSTSVIGTPVCFDDDDAALLIDPIGTVSMVNCPCGTTLTMNCAHGEMYEQFVAAIKADAALYSTTVAEVLQLMRAEIRSRAIT